MIQPLVSVLITCYNREKYLATAIESILKSTYTNFEIIISDDCSTDNSFVVAQEFEKKDERIKAYQNSQNIGDYLNRNKAASYAKGKYIKYIDSDDYIYPTGLQVLINMMEANPSADWGLCSLVQVNDIPYPKLLTPQQIYLHHFFSYPIFHKAPLSAIIKTEVFNLEGGFKSIRMAGDFEMWMRLGQKYNLLLMPDGIVWHRIHEHQEINYFSEFSEVYKQLLNDFLNSAGIPLNKAELVSVKKMLFKRKIKKLIAKIFKN